jgi:osmotically inducible lipoprotein OsmB
MKRGLLLILAALLCGCANMSRTEQRAVSGAAIGGVVAGPIGAGVGAGVGYIVEKSGALR